MMLMLWAIALIVLGVAVLIIKRRVRKKDVLGGGFIEDIDRRSTDRTAGPQKPIDWR
jgi:hypothetical protein